MQENGLFNTVLIQIFRYVRIISHFWFLESVAWPSHHGLLAELRFVKKNSFLNHTNFWLLSFWLLEKGRKVYQLCSEQNSKYSITKSPRMRKIRKMIPDVDFHFEISSDVPVECDMNTVWSTFISCVYLITRANMRYSNINIFWFCGRISLNQYSRCQQTLLSN